LQQSADFFVFLACPALKVIYVALMGDQGRMDDGFGYTRSTKFKKKNKRKKCSFADVQMHELESASRSCQ
jgi:hypothetical protein